MAEKSTEYKLRFMSLMQNCFPFRWKKYWDCGSRDFDTMMMRHDVTNAKLSPRDRILLAHLTRLWNGREEGFPELTAHECLWDERLLERMVREWPTDPSREYIEGVVRQACRSCRDVAPPAKGLRKT